MKLRCLVTLSFALTLAVGCRSDVSASAGDGTLRFTAIPDSNTTELSAKYKPVADYLSEALGVPVEYVPTSDYGASVEQFKNGDVQLAWFGGLTGVQARTAVTGAHAIAQGKEDPEYKSYFVANPESGLTKTDDFPTDLAGKSFTFGSQRSTSGRLMPEHFILENTGKTPAEFFGAEMNFSGKHDLTAKQVENGTFDAGVMSYTKYESMVAGGDLDPEKCFILWETPPYADYNWTAHPGLEELREGLTAELKQALIDMPAPLCGAFDRSKMIEAKDEHFARIAELASGLGFLD